MSHDMADASSLCLSALGESKRRMMKARQAKGLQIAHTAKISHIDNLWIIPSQSSSKKYAVDLDPNAPTCTCKDYKKHGQKCKHIHAAEFALQLESGEQLPEPPPQRRPTYRQAWPAYNKAQAQEKSQFLALLYDLCRGIDEPVQTFGRPRATLADVIFGLVFRTYSTLSGRRFMSDMRDAKQRGYLSKIPSYNSMFDYLQTKTLKPYLIHLISVSSLPLKSVETVFAVDSSGFSTCRFTRWFDVKYGKDEDWREWIKVHLMCGVKTHIVTSVEVSEAYANDSPYFQPFVDETVRNGFKLQEVSADKAYLSADNLKTVVKHGGKPYIPFKSNSLPDQNGELWKKLYHYYNLRRDEFLQHYHKRSNSESVFSMIKAKFGERLRCKTETAQLNEALCKVLAHNLCCVIQSMYELGIEPTFRTENDVVRKVG
jgi:transposase